MVKNFLMAGLGGMIGSMLRYAAVLLLKNKPFPYATYCVNIVGSFIIGIVAGYALKNATFNTEWRLFVATGICGGFTTFSSFSLESMQLLQQNRIGTAALYIVASVVIGIVATMSGWALTK
jgi:CrcB protein